MRRSNASWVWLTQHLIDDNHDEVVLTWDQLGKIVGGLPLSATKHPEWWSDDRPYRRAWRKAGYELRRVGVSREVVFTKLKLEPTVTTYNRNFRKTTGLSSELRGSTEYKGPLELHGIDPRSALSVLSCSKKKSEVAGVLMEIASPAWPTNLIVAQENFEAGQA